MKRFLLVVATLLIIVFMIHYVQDTPSFGDVVILPQETISLTCEKPLRDVAIDSPDKLVPVGMYQQIDSESFMVAEIATSTRFQHVISISELPEFQKRGFVEVPIKEVYSQVCTDGTRYKMYEATLQEFQGYSAENPNVKIEPISDSI